MDSIKILAILIAAFVLNMFDASNCRADEKATETMLRAESLGGLRLGLPEKDVLKLLGPPTKRSTLVVQETDGNYVQDWHYPQKGIDLQMSAGGKKSGAKTVASITASAPCTFATKKGIKIGDAESAARKVYARAEFGGQSSNLDSSLGFLCRGFPGFLYTKPIHHS